MVVMFTVPVLPALIACVAVASLKSMVSATMVMLLPLPLPLPFAIRAPAPEINSATFSEVLLVAVALMSPPIDVTLLLMTKP